MELNNEQPVQTIVAPQEMFLKSLKPGFPASHAETVAFQIVAGNMA